MSNLYPKVVNDFKKFRAFINLRRGENKPSEFELLADPELGAFEEVKRRLFSPLILAVPRYRLTYTLETDACGHQVGCATVQKQPDGAYRH